jgi:hypothetical protein
MLRESSRLEGESVDLKVIASGVSSASGGSGDAGAQGLPAEAELLAFAEAALGYDTDATTNARDKLAAAIGEPAMVDAACIIANFQRMVRIADATGIPLDTPVAMVTTDIREELGINDFGSADNTPAIKGMKKIAGRALGKLLPYVFRRMR